MTAPSHLELEGVHNFRALGPYHLAGGGHIRPGLVYRSGALELMTGADLALLTGDIRIHTILDLRHPDELTMTGRGHGLMDLVHACSIFPEELRQEDLIAELNGLYGTGPTPGRYLHYLEMGGDRFARAFEVFGNAAAYPVLVHCTAGKDRTGVLLAMLMEILGASDDDIAAEYGLSDASIDRLMAYLRSNGRVLEGTDDEIRARLSTPPERMSGFVTMMREKHGGAEPYLRSQGVSAETIANVRELLTERG
ncbi:MAG: tyrosine-protein phosphatase [Dehalococcoidia bacterium]|nr:tyrosine-protein phosphatase [Dehalococcoidia bacterium]